MGVTKRTRALYAVALGHRRWFLFIGETEPNRVPIAPYWLARFLFSEWKGRRRPETEAVCERHGVSVLFLVFIDTNDARGKLLRAKLSEVIHGVVSLSSN